MLPLISTMSTPASMTIETAPVMIWAMIALFVCASLGVLRAAWVARKRARSQAAELELLARVARRISESSDVANRPLAA
jgi:hypothetical protein